MTIATLNIDWAKKGKGKIEKYLNAQNFDILVLTEAVDLDLAGYKEKITSLGIRQNSCFEEVDYSSTAKNKTPYRTVIYSKYKAVKIHEVMNRYLSCAVEFETGKEKILVYATVIGTQFRKKPYAGNELNCCLSDCEYLYKFNKNLFIIGDLNTDFHSKQCSISSETTLALSDLIKKYKLFNPTDVLKCNVDHIIIPKSMSGKCGEASIFAEKDSLSGKDHQGVQIIIQ